MITRKNIQATLARRPFQPFRLHLKTGQRQDVKAAFNNVLGIQIFYVGVPRPGDNVPWPIAEKTVEIAIPEIDPLEAIS